MMLELEKLASLGGEEVEFAHVLDFQTEGIHDDKWIPERAKEGWIVISTDRGKQSGRAKFPKLCKQYGMTHVLFSASVHRMTGLDKTAALLLVWADISRLPTAPKGSRHQLQRSGGGFKLCQLDPPPS